MKEKLRLILLEKGNYDMKIAILGAGRIAVHMAETLAGMDDVEAYAVGARELERAEAFAEKYGFTKAYGSYEEMLADKEIDLVYIATPHSHHYKHAKMCLEAGKNVLCEKSFTVNANQARALFKLAEEKNLLITEAIWTRYMPSRKIIQDIVESGVIGEVTSLTANLSYAVTEKERIRKPELAGGALLDVGVYPINFASMVLGENLKDVQSSAIFEGGVDILETIIMNFEGNKMATLQSGVREISDRMGSILEQKATFRFKISIIRRRLQYLTRTMKKQQAIFLQSRLQDTNMKSELVKKHWKRAKLSVRKCLMLKR